MSDTYRVLVLTAACASLQVGCGGATAPPSTPPAPPVAAPAPERLPPSPGRTRYAVRPVPIPASFERAVQRQTRTMDGRPGPSYWQQRVDYLIEAELDPATAQVNGQARITYQNRSPDALSIIVLRLYQNVFAEGVQRVRRVPVTGGMTIERVLIGGSEALPARPGSAPGRSSYRVDGTVMTLALPRSLPPGETAVLDIAWHFTVPPAPAPRTAHDDNQVFVVGQWYPQVATYDDLVGWHTRPYWSNGEFYLEYGDFDVALTLPEGWLVAGSGNLINAQEVLPEHIIDRLLQANRTTEVVHVVTEDEIADGSATLRQPGGQLTWRFNARNVRDFAFAASNRYVWDVANATLPSGGSVPAVARVHALYRPGMPYWTEAAAFTRQALEFNARTWAPYPYPELAAVEGPIAGMEYPMLVFIGTPGNALDLYGVLAHEVAHQWWAMVVGSNESEYAWQDEGLANYTENLALRDAFPDVDPFPPTMADYLSIAGSDIERPSMREPDLYGLGPQYGVATYSKPATLFHALGGVIGDSTLHAALRVYASRWRFGHPTPYDLFNTIEDVAGQDLDWFWHPWFFETATMDQAIVAVDVAPAEAGEQVAVTVEDQGSAPMPVALVATLEDGTVRRVMLPVDPWLEGFVRQRYTFALPAPVVRIEIDPYLRFPDVDRSDNVWTRSQ